MADNIKKNNLKWYRSKKGVIGSIYNTQVQNSIKLDRRAPEYTKQELSSWLTSQSIFHVMFSEWVNSGYNKWLKPSVDRRCDYTHYCMSNIQLMTWRENYDKGRVLVSNPVGQYSKEGNLLGVFKSILEASLKTKVSDSNISRVCRGKRKTAGGYIWVHLDPTKTTKFKHNKDESQEV